jgi:hypothetical protein
MILALALSGAGWGSLAGPNARAAITNQYARLTKVMLARDLKGIGAEIRQMASKDFVHILEDGKSEGERKFIGNLQGPFFQAKRVNVAEIKVLAFETDGTSAMTLGSLHLNVVVASGKGDYILDRRDFGPVFWRLEGGQWKLNKLVTKNVKVTINGKPVASGGRAI